MIFIGLTMTIIAHWPGSTSIGENPLKIAGPILLAVGGVLFFIGVVLICCLNRRERQRWERMINKFAASRQPYVISILKLLQIYVKKKIPSMVTIRNSESLPLK